MRLLQNFGTIKPEPHNADARFKADANFKADAQFGTDMQFRRIVIRNPRGDSEGRGLNDVYR